MKKPFNISPSQQGATCSLCEDTLLRHISQSRMFWYCPSCRQEMVCEEPKTLTKSIATRIGQVTPQRKLAKVTDINKHVSINAS